MGDKPRVGTDSASSISDYFYDLNSFEKISWSILLSIYLLVLIVSLGKLAQYTFSNNPQIAGSYASVISGLSTIGLVIITFWYAIQTRRMASEMERSRNEEEKHREKQRELELEKLRRALLREIEAVEGVSTLAKNYNPNYSLYTRIFPSTIYDNNSKDIGLLNSTEIEAVVEYYTLVDLVNDHLAAQRKLDTKIERSVFEQVYYAISFSWLLHWRERKNRTQMTREKLSQLADARSRAISELRENLDGGEGSSVREDLEIK